MKVFLPLFKYEHMEKAQDESQKVDVCLKQGNE